jgi:hypothetical protein
MEWTAIVARDEVMQDVSALRDAEREAEIAGRECEELAAEICRMKALVRERKGEIFRLREAHERLVSARPGEVFAAMRAEVSRKSAEMRGLQSRIGALLLRHLSAERRLEGAKLCAEALRATAAREQENERKEMNSTRPAL